MGLIVLDCGPARLPLRALCLEAALRADLERDGLLDLLHAPE